MSLASILRIGALTALLAPMAPMARAETPFTATPLTVAWADPATAPDADLERLLVEATAWAGSSEAPGPALFAATIVVHRRTAALVPGIAPVPGSMRRSALATSAEGRGLLAAVRADLASDGPLGPVPELGRPDLFCKPAGFAFDREAAARLAAALDPSWVAWTTDAHTFRAQAPGATPFELAPGTLAFARKMHRTAGAELTPAIYTLSTGLEGRFVTQSSGIWLVERRSPTRGLATTHTCFGRVGGAWRIVAVVAAAKPR